jgi:hypothetical protein
MYDNCGKISGSNDMTETYEEFIQRKNKEFLNPKKKVIKFEDVARKGEYCFEREAWTFMQQHNLGEKAFLIERLKLVKKEGEIHIIK